LCGRRLEGLQLICHSLGSLTTISKAQANRDVITTLEHPVRRFLTLAAGFCAWAAVVTIIMRWSERAWSLPPSLVGTVCLGFSYAVLAAVWPAWFASHPTATRLVGSVGHRRARAIYIGVGLGIMVLGVLGWSLLEAK
jgi:hypothetical protein